MSKLRLLPYADLKKIIEHCGYKWDRRVGSHNVFKNTTGRIVVIPDHGSDVILRPLLRKIIRDISLAVDEYNNLVDTIL